MSKEWPQLTTAHMPTSRPNAAIPAHKTIPAQPPVQTMPLPDEAKD